MAAASEAYDTAGVICGADCLLCTEIDGQADNRTIKRKRRLSSWRGDKNKTT